MLEYDSMRVAPPFRGCSAPWADRAEPLVELRRGPVARPARSHGRWPARAPALRRCRSSHPRRRPGRPEWSRTCSEHRPICSAVADGPHRDDDGPLDPVRDPTHHSSTRIPPIDPPTTAAHRRCSGGRPGHLDGHLVPNGHDRETGTRTVGRRGRATPDRSFPGIHRAHSDRRRNTGRCRSAHPARSAGPPSRSRMAGPGWAPPHGNHR